MLGLVVVDEVLPLVVVVVVVVAVIVVVPPPAVVLVAAMIVLFGVAVAVAMAHSRLRRQPPARNSGTRHQQAELMMSCAERSVGESHCTIWALKFLPTKVLLLQKASSLQHLGAAAIWISEKRHVD